jgi:hypothetical protein
MSADMGKSDHWMRGVHPATERDQEKPMRKFIISAAVAVIAAVSFAAPSEAGNYGYGHESYGYKSHGHHYGYKPYRHIKRHHGHRSHWGGHWGGNWGGKVIYRKKHYSYY